MLNTVKKIKCPSCGAEQEVTVWESINVSEAPDLKADILSRKVNIFECHECASMALVPAMLLYTDEEKKLMIYFAPCKADEKKKVYSELAENTKDEIKALDKYNLRFVTEYNDLMEKILIFDSGLDDKAVEFLKMLVLMQEPEKAEFRKAMYGKTENGYIELMITDSKEKQVYTTNIDMSTYNTLKNELKASGVKEYSFNWEMVDVNFASRLLMGMNNA